jgi:putative FmdB family regulatory protein
MPIYEYRCRNGHTFEVFQSMADDPVSACEECGAPVERVFHPVAVHFKGSGFYTTDYAKKGAAQASGDGGTKSEAGDKAEPKKAESKTSESSSGAKEKPKSSSGE